VTRYGKYGCGILNKIKVFLRLDGQNAGDLPHSDHPGLL